MQSFGLIGGIGSGKSTVAAMFCRLGTACIDADQIGHEVLLLPAVQIALRRRWGDAVFAPDGKPDRRSIAALVFGDTEKARQELEFLTNLSHPLIAEEVQRKMREFDVSEKKWFLFDAPLLLEAGWDTLVEHIIFVAAPREVRLNRVLLRGWTEAEFEAREKAQLSIEEKRRRADSIIDNSGTPDETLEQLERFLRARSSCTPPNLRRPGHVGGI